MKTQKSSLLKKFMATQELSVLIPLVIMMVISTIIQPAFLSPANLFDILRTASFTFILAVPLTYLMASCQMDLSIGATTAFGGVIAAIAANAGLPLGLALLLGLLAGSTVGFLNGVLVVRCGLPGFISTMGMQYAINGLISVITGNNAVLGLSSSFKSIAQTRILGNMSMVIVYALVIGVAGHVLLKKTKYGREVLAVGGNRETAYLSGIDPNKKHIQLYTAVGFFAALTGILYASRFSSAQINAGQGTELTIMASVIIGGTSLFGGSGTVVGSGLGCILFAMITNALIVMGVSTFWQKTVFGVILILALFIDRYRRSKSAGE